MKKDLSIMSKFLRGKLIFETHLSNRQGSPSQRQGAFHMCQQLILH